MTKGQAMATQLKRNSTMVHEMAHLIVPTHSERFIATFSVVMGSARYQQRSLLQKQGRTFSVVQRRYGIYWVADE